MKIKGFQIDPIGILSMDMRMLDIFCASRITDTSGASYLIVTVEKDDAELSVQEMSQIANLYGGVDGIKRGCNNLSIKYGVPVEMGILYGLPGVSAEELINAKF